MRKPHRCISLSHLSINEEKRIGISFRADKVIEALVRTLPGVKWNAASSRAHIANTKQNLDAIFKTFRGEAWVDLKYFSEKRGVMTENSPLNIEWLRNRKLPEGHLRCPAAYFDKLESKRYSLKTAQHYVSHFERYLYFHDTDTPEDLDERHINTYLQYLTSIGQGRSSVNLALNAIKFYYEVVCGMPHRYYHIDRPRKEERLPSVLSVDEVKQMLKTITNAKHRAIFGLLYGSGLRRGELLALKPEDIDSDRMLVKVRSGKGSKDRYTLLSTACLSDLRAYYRLQRPETMLFEGAGNKPYSATSVTAIIRRAATAAGISKRVTPHTLRHSFATHLLESGVDLRRIQILMGHKSSTTTEIYTHVAKSTYAEVKSPLDVVT